MAATVVATLVAAVSLAVVVPAAVVPASAFATSTLAVDKQGPGSVLADSGAAFTLNASNPVGAGATALYNLTFRDVLAPGVTYTAGSSTPADLGDPVVVTQQVEIPVGSDTFVPQQTLIWSNVADLAVGSSYQVGYRVTADPDRYPVGSSSVTTRRAPPRRTRASFPDGTP